MTAKVKEFFTFWNLIEKVLIPVFAYFSLGFVQKYIFNWSTLTNASFAKAVELSFYGLTLVLLYTILYSLSWFHPTITIKIVRQDSSPARPETSFVLYIGQSQEVNIKMTLQCNPTFWMRQMSRLVPVHKLGIELSWRPSGLLECNSNSSADRPYYEVSTTSLLLYPIPRMNLTNKLVDIDYSFRFTLGAQPVVQRAYLEPRHLSLWSRLVFGISCDRAFLFDIAQ